MHFVVLFSGSVVDVGKLLSQLKRSEKARSNTEANLKSALKNVGDLKEASEKHTSVKDKLQVIFFFHFGGLFSFMNFDYFHEF